ncbi:MAG: DMT family transporter [Mailhella sp.]
MTVSPRALMLLLVFCYTMWGGGMIAMKYAFESFTVMHVIFARTAFAAVFYAVLFPFWRHLPYEKGDWKYLLAMVMFEPVLFFLFETFSLKFTTASQGGVIAACFPICTAVAAWLFLKEKLGGRTVVAIVFAVLGVACTSYFAEGDARASHPLLGNALMFGAVLSSTGYAVTVRYISRRYSFLSISAIQAIGGSLIFLPFAVVSPIPQSVTLPALGGLLYMGIGVGILVYMSFNFSLKYLEAGIVALFGNLIPIFTLLFAYILLDERLNTMQMLGVALTLSGVFIATTGSGKKER